MIAVLARGLRANGSSDLLYAICTGNFAVRRASIASCLVREVVRDADEVEEVVLGLFSYRQALAKNFLPRWSALVH